MNRMVNFAGRNLRWGTAILLFTLCISATGYTQFPALTIHHLTTREGLSDGVVRSIGQDRFGYMWIGTVSGLNRYDGKHVKHYQFDPRRSGTPPASVPRSIFSDSKGFLWVGFNNGLYRFDHATDQFSLVPGTEEFAITKIIEDTLSGRLFVLAGSEILCLLKSTEKIEKVSVDLPAIKDFTINNRQLLLLSEDNIFLYNLDLNSSNRMNKNLCPEKTMNKISADHDGNIWIGFSNVSGYIRMIDNKRTKTKTYKLSPQTNVDSINNTIREIYVDNRNRIWVMNTSLGLAVYSREKDSFASYEYIIGRPNSFSSLLSYSVFQSHDGLIWIGTEGYGVDYFNPDKTLFHVIAPYEDRNIPSNALWARSAVEDLDGNIWLSWAGGICQYDIRTKKYTGFDNFYSGRKQLHNNSVRALHCDGENNIWIGTASGMNRYNASKKSIEFLTIHDSLPETEFYWSIKEDQNHIWFGTGNGLFYKDKRRNKTYSHKSHPILSQAIDTGVRTVFVDARSRLWFGMNGTGLVLFDPATNYLRKWNQSEGQILGNTITAIQQEENGILWFSTFYGLMSYDEKHDSFRFYTHADKLPSPKCAGILTDDANRLWTATTAGLAVMDPARKNFTNFTIDDGLPTLEFSDMPATKLSNGDFIFPTVMGFVRFNPMLYPVRHDTLATYITSIQMHDALYKGTQNPELLTDLPLKHNQNFFSFQLVAFNYDNPARTWYAYKLEGFDNDWIVSSTGIAKYTNVPGGNYIFRYKASVNPDQWNVPEKKLTVKIDTVYYKTWWFMSLVAIAILLIFYFWYRTRINNDRKIYSLQSRAQILEKEKALVKFEGLKQQLNPHFLFNSLSSLGSLIRTNQDMAISFLEKLSKTYRYILQSRDFDLISLEEEIRFAKSYISLLETRFVEGLKINFDIAPEALKKKVVPVIIQNMVDNAIKHNMTDQDTPLTLDIYTSEGYLIVQNNIQLKKQVETSNKQGLNNLLSLYRYLTEQPMIIEKTSRYFTVKIPLI